MPKKPLTARWINGNKVGIYRGELLIGYVGNNPGQGWKVFPLTSARSNSRTFSADPSVAIQKFYGKRVEIQAS